METRKYKVLSKSPGGNASKGAVAYSLSLPVKWVRDMGITPDERDVQLCFDGNEIIIRKATPEENK